MWKLQKMLKVPQIINQGEYCLEENIKKVIA